jgi:hypothetical protein
LVGPQPIFGLLARTTPCDQLRAAKIAKPSVESAKFGWGRWPDVRSLGLRRGQPIQAKPVPRIGEAIDAAEYRGYRPETGTARNQEHDQDLVFDGLDRGYSAEDLPCHHAGQ